MTRPLRVDEARQVAAILVDLANRLATSDRTLAVIAAALDHGYPARGSTAPTNPTNRTDDDGHPIPPDTRPEALAIQPDQARRQAADLVDRIRHHHRQSVALVVALAQWDPDRPVRHCPRCGHPYEGTETRCQQRDPDGVQCGAAENTIRKCANDPCGRILGPGEARRDGRCNRCDVHVRRHGTEWPDKPSDRIASVDRIHLQDNLITTEDPAP